MSDQPLPSPFSLMPLPVGAVRVTLDPLDDSEVRWRVATRDLDTTVARRMAIDLLAACEEADRLRAAA